MNAGVQQSQGQDPREQVFKSLYPVLYAAETPVSNSYVTSSLIAAACLDSMLKDRGGLQDKIVLDLGGGYGTTAAVVANFMPNGITSVDNSAAMTELLNKVMLSKDDLGAWLKERGAEEILGDLFVPTLRHLEQRRAEFQKGLFYESGRVLSPVTMSSMEVEDKLCRPILWSFDAVIGNNFLHWPVNQQKEALQKSHPDMKDPELTERAIWEALRPIAATLNKGGAAVMMEPKDFMMLDDQPELDAAMDANTMVAHPLFQKFHTIFNRLLKERHGKDRKVPAASPIFKTSRLADICKWSGLELERVTWCENAFSCDPVDAFYVRLPLLLGGIDLPFDDKMAIGKAAMAEFRASVSAKEMRMPIKTYYFFICLRKM